MNFVKLMCTAALLVLPGCETYPIAKAYGEKVSEQTKQFNNDYRDVAAAALCATTIGAHYRDTNPKAQAARLCICGGQCGGGSE